VGGAAGARVGEGVAAVASRQLTRRAAALYSRAHTVNVDFQRIEYMVLAKYQHLSILELILLVKQHILILC